MSEGRPERRHRVVVVGGGFGGLSAARELGAAPVDVVVVDRLGYHLFQPLLYQVASGALSEGQIAPALRSVLRRYGNVDCLLGEVREVDVEGRTLSVERPIGSVVEVPYDSLIVAAGVHQSYFGHDEFARYAPGMKTIDDALKIRRRIFGAFEMAESADDPVERDAWLTFALVGAGPTGVELAGQVREAADHALRGEYRRIDPSTARVLLFDAGDEPLASFGPELARRGAKALQDVGVELRMQSRVENIDEYGLDVATADGGTERIAARTVLWTAGVEASPLGKLVAEACGAETDRAGRVLVEPDCSVAGHPEVFVVGDMMHLDDLPGLAEVAMQSGRHAAKVITARVAGTEDPGPFRYVDLGSMAYIARHRAVVRMRRVHLSGRLAWWTWLAVHLATLTTWKNRVSAFFSWLAIFLRRRRSQRAFPVAGLYPGGVESGDGEAPPPAT